MPTTTPTPAPRPRQAQALQRKAEERNPDEFYFAMETARTKEGVHVVPTAEANKYTQEELALMKTQDAGYLRAKAQAEAKVGWVCVSMCGVFLGPRHRLR